MIYFISDIHLGYGGKKEQKERETLLLEFLRKARDDMEQLWIAGDLFDYWFEYKTVIPRAYTRTLAMLYEIRQSGIPVEYLMGNHDFGHKTYFENDLDIPVHRNDISREILGKKFYLSHGDGKAYNDTGYKILKKILRNPVSNKLYRLLHPDLGIWLASSSSHSSRGMSDTKDYGRSDGMKDFARARIEQDGYDYVIMGHRHKAEMIEFNGGYYINLGEWLKNPTFGRFDGEEFYLEKVRDVLR